MSNGYITGKSSLRAWEELDSLLEQVDKHINDNWLNLRQVPYSDTIPFYEMREMIADPFDKMQNSTKDVLRNIREWGRE